MYLSKMSLRWIISHIFLPRMMQNVQYLLRFWHSNQKYLISIALDLCRLIVLLTIPTAVVLSTCNGVGGWGWPNSFSINRMTFASCAFKNNAPNSASAADAATSFKMEHVVRIFPFSLIGSLSLSKLPRKKYPPALLRARAAVKYDAPKRIFRIISKDQKRILAFGFVAM